MRKKKKKKVSKHIFALFSLIIVKFVQSEYTDLYNYDESLISRSVRRNINEDANKNLK